MVSSPVFAREDPRIPILKKSRHRCSLGHPVHALWTLALSPQAYHNRRSVDPQRIAIPPSRLEIGTTVRDLDAENDLSNVLTDQTNLLPFKRVMSIFMALALCVVAVTLDAVIVPTTLPTISAALNAGSILPWIPSAYLLTSTAFQPLYGRFSDIFGRKVALSVAMIIFMAGNLVAGFSQNVIQLIVSRAIAGIGGGGIISLARIVMSDIVSLRERGKYHGIIMNIAALGYIGPIISGAFSQKASWRWCFWVTIPIIFCAVCVAILVLPLKPVHGNMKKKLLAVDYVGAGLMLAGCTIIILPLIWGGVTFPWNSPVILALLCSAFVITVTFCIWEWKGAKLPIVPMYIFKEVTVTGVYITMFINGFVYFSSLSYLPQFFQIVLGHSPISAGVLLISVLSGQMVASWVVDVIVSHTGRYRTIIHLGFTIWAISCGCLSTVTPETPTIVLVVSMLTGGIGAGLTLQTAMVAAHASVPRKDMSVATAFKIFIRLLGGTLSLSTCSSIINNNLVASMKSLGLSAPLISKIGNSPSHLRTPMEFGLSSSEASYILAQGYTQGFRHVFILNGCLTTIAVAVSVFMIKHKELTREENEIHHEKARVI